MPFVLDFTAHPALEVPFASGVADVSCMREGCEGGHAVCIALYSTSCTRNTFRIGGVGGEGGWLPPGLAGISRNCAVWRASFRE